TLSLRSLMGKYYREHGRYSRSLIHWEWAWKATKAAAGGNAKKIADFTFAHWTRLLASLGRTKQLESLLAETKDRVFDGGPLSAIIGGTREGYAAMLVRPGDAFRCGTYALDNVA